MKRVLHIIDLSTPADMLRQLSLLAGDDDLIASVGPAPQLAGVDLPARAVHCPLGIAECCGPRIDKAIGDVHFVHAWSVRSARAGAALCRRRKLRFVLSMPCRPDRRQLRRRGPGGFRSASGLTVPTHADRAAMVAAGLDGSRIHVLPPPARPLNDAEGRRRRVREQLGIGDGQRLLVAPSEMIRDAGHKYASWAHAIIRQMLSDVALLMPGGGPIERHVRFFAATTGYDDEVFLTGDRFGLEDVLAAADVALFLANRPSGVAPLAAAMAAGVPIVATNTPQIAELAPHEQAALLSRPRDPRAASASLLRVIEDSALARRLGQAARRRAAELFNVDSVRRRLAEIHDSAIAGRSA